MAERQVAVTGIGLVTAAGHDVGGFWQHLIDGRTAIAPIRRAVSERINLRLLAEVIDFDPLAHFAPKRAALLDRFAQFAVVAARAAVHDAGIDLDREDRDRIGAVIGSGVGGIETLDTNFATFFGPALGRPQPMTIPKAMLNAAASHVCMDLRLRGESYAVASACASGTQAIGHAFRKVRSGEADICLAGGAEACLSPGTIKAWEMLRVVSHDVCRPFSADRSGMVLGEGSAVLVLEEAGRARARGAAIYGYVAGYGASADAGDITSPDPQGAALAMSAALRDAGLAAEQITYINAHGTGTMINDASETMAIRAALGAQADRLCVSSIKGVLGHALGASGALEAAATLIALREATVPPTTGWRVPDPACDLDIVPFTPRALAMEAALSNSFAFGGLNAVLAFRSQP
jgi:nodulation protein E